MSAAIPMAPVLNRRLVLESPERVPDGAGGGGLGWLELGVLWGAITPRAGRELERGGRQGSRVSHRILVRAAPVGASTRPRADQRFRENGRTFRIRAVTEADARGRFLTCWADEETTA
ncbi:phage head-tail adaptor, putative, SPP1 family [Albimonas donghaensis]|uniref:Phage head-tail adaptor, putative, SPP1 family n=2 Tax=Albimonas donghaensis TaxID=356660 RepID=A0A1H2SVD2_9RHOB|nr:phage head-tail adaptor, putative, SPP1 family [Albimonas donghaensis]